MQPANQGLKILVITPEVTCVRDDMETESRIVSARSSGLGVICAAQTHALSKRGVDVRPADLKTKPANSANARTAA